LRLSACGGVPPTAELTPVLGAEVAEKIDEHLLEILRDR